MELPTASSASTLLIYYFFSTHISIEYSSTGLRFNLKSLQLHYFVNVEDSTQATYDQTGLIYVCGWMFCRHPEI